MSLQCLFLMFKWEKQHDKRCSLFFFSSKRKFRDSLEHCFVNLVESWLQTGNLMDLRSLPCHLSGRAIPQEPLSLSNSAGGQSNDLYSTLELDTATKGYLKSPFIIICLVMCTCVHNYICLLVKEIMLCVPLPLRQTTVNLNCVLYAQLSL